MRHYVILVLPGSAHMTVENDIKSSGDRVVVITGGGTGIGRTMAETFARYGDQVVISGRHEDTLLGTAEAIGSNCSWQQADVSRSAQVTAAVNAIVARVGKLMC
jgi:3-oxoacyl-[acyl-carrier protein] reductase